jgi:hypothetical protein
MTLPGTGGSTILPGPGMPDPARSMGCGSGELVPVPGMVDPSLRISVTASAVIRKNCHVPWGESVQSSRAETALSGSMRNSRITALHRCRISCGPLTFERVRRIFTNHVQNKEKITKSNGSPAFSGTSHRGIFRSEETRRNINAGK